MHSLSVVVDVRSDLTELELPDTMKTNFPDPADVLNFALTITPDEGPSDPPHYMTHGYTPQPSRSSADPEARYL